MKLYRTNSNNKDFITLVQQLDAYLAAVDGTEHSFYAQYNTIATLNHALVLYADDIPVACGAFKEIESGIAEVKRMFTLPECRGKGYAGKILAGLETWAKEEGFSKCRLETGKRMPDAVGLYTSKGYSVIPNYGQYAGVDNSVCFEKKL